MIDRLSSIQASTLAFERRLGSKASEPAEFVLREVKGDTRPSQTTASEKTEETEITVQAEPLGLAGAKPFAFEAAEEGLPPGSLVDIFV